jgi:hypothetical protein
MNTVDDFHQRHTEPLVVWFIPDAWGAELNIDVDEGHA